MTLLIIAVTLAIAAGAGIVAALSPTVIRVGVLVFCAFVFLDVTFHLPGFFSRLRPQGRRQVTRDEKRIADLHRIKAALEQYVAQVGPLPRPADYGEAAGLPGFWQGWWDVSSRDVNRNQLPFLDFLVDDGILSTVPVDPLNSPAADGDPRGGSQYVYFVVPAEYEYAGGTCDARPNRWHYLLGITDLEEEPSRPPTTFRGSGCECLWRDQPNYFQKQFDYVVCGTFEVTPENRARQARFRAERTAAALAAKQAAAVQAYGARDQRRVDDLLRIDQALKSYLAKVGPLPTPYEYGEAERPGKPGFWQGYWDLSTEDGDGDGKPFLDFLSEKGIMPVVPVDPENARAADGDPKGGRQYVYFVASATEKYGGGTCGARKKEWVYMLGITDLQSELTHPPERIRGSGCECLWRDQPNYFQAHFDYVTCGTFSR
ncbi:MAG TPA: hypothetical protein VFV49_13825 [Thermoanaerobaculia bacterium]|nr:hypothetical protein [Thermoanaerobaculia bacterium]